MDEVLKANKLAGLEADSGFVMKVDKGNASKKYL
jgi:hypothetical protein